MQQQQITTVPNSAKVRKSGKIRISAKDSSFATILVGPKLDKFTVHEALLTHHSEFFRKALRGSFEEARSKTVKLAAEKTQIFELFVHWLYHQRFPNKGDAKELSELWLDDGKGAETLISNLIRLYIFCDKFQVPVLKEKTMTELFFYMEDPDVCLPSGDMVCFAYENLSEGSPLLRFIVDMYCLWAKWDMWQDFERLEWPLAFVKDILMQYAEHASNNRSAFDITQACDYHEHLTYEERAACMQQQENEAEDWKRANNSG